jgi:hypothetical protein
VHKRVSRTPWELEGDDKVLEESEWAMAANHHQQQFQGKQRAEKLRLSEHPVIHRYQVLAGKNGKKI